MALFLRQTLVQSCGRMKVVVAFKLHDDLYFGGIHYENLENLNLNIVCYCDRSTSSPG